MRMLKDWLQRLLDWLKRGHHQDLPDPMPAFRASGGVVKNVVYSLGDPSNDPQPLVVPSLTPLYLERTDDFIAPRTFSPDTVYTVVLDQGIGPVVLMESRVEWMKRMVAKLREKGLLDDE